jgi:hypothetical protein
MAGPLRGQLFRNDLSSGADARPVLRFTNVTAASRIEATGYGMGVAAGDYDNDGWIDIYLTSWGSNQLWKNNGDGTFSDVARASGVDDPRWGTSATFFDYDRDGLLDLFVCNYVHYSFANHKPCYAASTALDYCGPLSYEPFPSRLLHNRGDGSFEDVSAASGIAREYGAALGVVAADFDGDRWPDLYVANDGTENLLWINQKNGSFRNQALLAGCAVNREGKAEGSMGVDAGDFDGDGDEDLFMTHIVGEHNTLYLSDGKGAFEERSVEANLAVASWNSTAFGTAWFDYDNDGWLDLFCANGAVKAIPELAAAGDPYPLHQRNQLFHNSGNGRFAEATASAGQVFELSEVSRGAAFGDLDNDGDTDLVVTNNDGRARLLLNTRGSLQPWIGLRLISPKLKRDLTGARVAVIRRGQPPLWRRAHTDASYCSSSDPRLLVGLGGSNPVEGLQVLWPDGSAEEFPSPPPRAYTTLVQGTGKRIE